MLIYASAIVVESCNSTSRGHDYAYTRIKITMRAMFETEAIFGEVLVRYKRCLISIALFIDDSKTAHSVAVVDACCVLNKHCSQYSG